LRKALRADLASRGRRAASIASIEPLRGERTSGRTDIQIAHAVRHSQNDAEQAIRNLTGVRVVLNNIEVKPRAGSIDVQRAIEEALDRRAKRAAERVNVEGPSRSGPR
jgi:hypothetical protein